MDNQILRLGLITDSKYTPAWYYAALEKIRSSNCAEFVALFLVDRPPVDGNIESLRGVREAAGGGFVYKTLNAFDQRLFVGKQGARAKMSLGDVFPASVTVRAESTADVAGRRLQISRQDIETIKGYDLDILLAFGYAEFDGELLPSAKYGLWFYDGSQPGGEDAAGFWEAIRGRHETTVSLSLHKAGLAERWTIYRSSFLTYPFSAARNRNNVLWASSAFLARQIELFHRLGEVEFMKRTAQFNPGSELPRHETRRVPSNFPAVWAYGRLFLRQAGEFILRHASLDSWYLMFDLSAEHGDDFSAYRKIVPPSDRFWADPHIVRKDGKYFIFVEEYRYQGGKGSIAVLELDGEGKVSPSVPVLEESYHLSYPFVFEYGQRYYMVPESSANNSIDLYECSEFPARWQFKMRLMSNVRAVDTTLFYREGKWWLFTGLSDNQGTSPDVELFLFYADEPLTTDWKPHPENPVVPQISVARPAGNLFVQDGKVYRPSQNCATMYGAGFDINEVQCLTTTQYREQKVAEVKPDWDDRLLGTHTCSKVEGLTVIDCYRRRRKFGLF